ncbi:MAG: transposase, partial [Gammaproteobacteria bacterium]|nr:transposase [Gammaproteobacteria bacterium]
MSRLRSGRGVANARSARVFDYLSDRDGPKRGPEGVHAAKASQRDKVERLARYVSRPPVATARLSLTRGGNVRYALKTPYRDGTTHVIFEPEEFMVHIPVRHPFGAAYGRANRQSCRFVIARLVALVPKPRAHLTRYHGLFAPASPDRAQVVPRIHAAAATERGEVSATDRQRAMSWAQRLRRVSAIDIE